MKTIPSNINMRNTRFLNAAIKCLLIMVSLMYGSSSFAASAEPDGFEAGVAAFNRGDFAAARAVIANYTDHDTERLRAKAYIFAMQDRKNPAIAPSEELKVFIVAQVDADPLYKALSAKLHLMGYHPASNPQTGLMALAGLGELHGYAYALYTLGLYHEGVFTVPPSPANLLKAKLKYEEARATGHKAASERFNAVERLLNPEPAGGWEGDDDGVSQLGDRLGDMPAWNPRGAGQGVGGRGGAGGTSVAPSMRSQTSGRFYEGGSVLSRVSVDSEAPRGTATSRATPTAAHEDALARATAAEAALAAERSRVAQLEAAAQREQEASRRAAAVAAEQNRIAQLEAARQEADRIAAWDRHCARQSEMAHRDAARREAEVAHASHTRSEGSEGAKISAGETAIVGLAGAGVIGLGVAALSYFFRDSPQPAASSPQWALPARATMEPVPEQPPARVLHTTSLAASRALRRPAAGVSFPSHMFGK